MPSPVHALRALERVRADHGPAATARKLELLRVLERAELGSARSVLRLHEALLFLHAYPDDEALLALVRRMLDGFYARADLRRHRAALADSGIAGTDIRYSFFAPMARWLVERCGARMSVEWDAVEEPERERLKRWLDLVVPWGETAALAELPLSVREWVARLAGPAETDAAFLVRRFAALAAAPPVRDALLEELALPMRIAGGPGAPERTTARHGPSPVRYRSGPLRTERPDLARAVRVPPRAIRAVSAREGAELVDMAREAMVTRSRDLDPFAWGDPRDVRIVDLGDGLELACIGVVPQMRFVLEACYGFLTLQSGVPVGYVLASALNRSAEVAYNVFPANRGGEAAHAYGRVLGALRALFDARVFSVPPYQLGHHNEEGLASGAWWFYQKLGFRPRDPGALRTMERELARLRRDPRHRSSRRTLEALVAHPVFWPPEDRRPDALGAFSSGRVGLAMADDAARRHGADREAATAEACGRAAELVGARDWRRWPHAERLAFERWAPLVPLLPGVARWPRADRRALARVIRAKGGRRETDYLRLFDAHARLRRALARLARREA